MKTGYKSARYIFANNITYFRLKKGWTQEKLAEKLGSKATYISCLENGKINTKIDFIDKIAKVYDIEVEQLFILREIQINHHVNRHWEY